MAGGFRPEVGKDHSRGGFQNRDVGEMQQQLDLGPEFGMDFAQYVRPLEHFNEVGMLGLTKNDDELHMQVHHRLQTLKMDLTGLELKISNGFVLLKGQFSDYQIKKSIESAISTIYGVKMIINQIEILS
jgi:hypothetical protein